MDTSWKMMLKSYWQNGLETAWIFYVPLIMIAMFVLSVLIIRFVRTKTTKPEILKDWSSVYLAGIFTIVSTVLIMLCLMLFSDFFSIHFYQLGFLLGLVLMAVFTIFAFTRICNLGRKKSSNALGMVVTSAEQKEKYNKFKKYILLLWLLSFSLAIPFVTLLVKNERKYLVSIVLDNSVSMEQYLPQCTQALATALFPTRKSADYVFTTLTNDGINESLAIAGEKVDAQIEKGKIKSDDEAWKEIVSRYYEALINQKSPRKVFANTVVYNDAQSLFNDFSQVNVCESSPIYDGIWQNYLESENIVKHNSYVSKKMIVITDGEDLLYILLAKANLKNLCLRKDIFQQKGKSEQTIDEFYDAICTINYGELTDEMLFRDCATSIDETYDGNDAQSYFDAFRSILPEMFFDAFLLYLLIGFSVLLFGILFIIKTVKL